MHVAQKLSKIRMTSPKLLILASFDSEASDMVFHFG